MSVSSSIREYGGVVWTNHALERLKRRGISQSEALSVMRKPEKSFPGKKNNSVKFIKTISGRPIHLVATMSDQKKWVVMSAWVRGENDQWGFPERYIYQLVGWLGKMLTKGFKKLVNV